MSRNDASIVEQFNEDGPKKLDSSQAAENTDNPIALSTPKTEEFKGFSALDRFFFILTASGLLGGTASIFLVFFFPVAALPAIFFGTGISSLVYRFMGGIKPDDSITIGNIVKLSGTLGSLIGSIYAINFLLEPQIPRWRSVATEPSNPLIVLTNTEGQWRTTNVDIKTRELKRNFTFTTIPKPNDKILNTFKAQCWEGKGICEDEPKKVTVVVDKTLPKGQAKVCECNQTQTDFFGYPLIIEGKSTKNLAPLRIVRVDVLALDRECKATSSSPQPVMLSPEDAKEILGSKTEGIASASIAPVRNRVSKAPVL